MPGRIANCCSADWSLPGRLDCRAPAQAASPRRPAKPTAPRAVILAIFLDQLRTRRQMIAEIDAELRRFLEPRRQLRIGLERGGLELAHRRIGEARGLHQIGDGFARITSRSWCSRFSRWLRITQ